MAGKKENIKALFSNARTRVIILFTLILVIVTIVIGYIKFSSSNDFGASESDVNRAPSTIRSIPGALNQTEQYANLQQQQNIEQAQQASKSGASAIPTIIRTQKFGDGVQSVGAAGGTGSVGFNTLANADLGGMQSSLWLQTVKNARCSKSSLDQAMAQGAILQDFKTACSCKQLKSFGYGINDLTPLCSCIAMKAAGFNISQFKAAGFSAQKLRQCGFVACEERAAGFSAQEMKDAGYSDGELKGAGFSDSDIARAGGLPDGISAQDVQKAGCSLEAVQRLRATGVSAAAIRRINGCSARQLKAAGFNALDLKNAGFSAADLKNAGFTPTQLKNAGYSARDLLNAGFTPKSILSSGFSPEELQTAEQLLPPNMTTADVKNAGCSETALKRERAAGVSALLIRKNAGCSAKTLTDAGFTSGDLENAGFTPAELKAAVDSQAVDDNTIKAAGCNSASLHSLLMKGVSAKRIHDLNNCDAQALKNAGFDAKDLVNAGFTPMQLAAAGFTPEQIKAAQLADTVIKAAGCDPTKLKTLMAQGVSARRIHALNGCDVQALKNTGFDAKALTDAGFTPAALLSAGFTPEQLKQAAMGALAGGATANCNPASLKAAHDSNVSAATIKQTLGCSAEALKNAGFDAKSLADAGFTPADLLSAGFTPTQLKQAGVAITPAGVIAAGRIPNCNPASLKAAHDLKISAATIKQTLGCSAQALKNAGFSALDLKTAGFTAAELKNAGFGLSELKNAGFAAKDLHAAGFTAAQLKAAGFNAKALLAAGINPAELKAAGFSASELKAAGLSANALKKAGFNANDLHDAGYSATDLKNAGFTAADLKKAGFSNQAIQAAGYSAQDSALAGLDALNQPSFNGAVIPSIATSTANNKAVGTSETQNAKQLQEIMTRQQAQMADQRYQQKIQQRTAAMLTAANQNLQAWKTAPVQVYEASSIKDKGDIVEEIVSGNNPGLLMRLREGQAVHPEVAEAAVIKTGDIVFAVMDTSVNSDEPGPILATIVSGALKGSKLIGSFVLPANADKMVISFNTLSITGASKTMSVSAYAIDPNTARTALSSETDHHYLSRYGSLFASTFLEGFGNAFQSADTTITIGGTGGTTDTTVQNGIGRSALENAVIGLATVGKAWGQVAQQNMSRPTTVQVYSGTGIGVLFTQDLKIT